VIKTASRRSVGFTLVELITVLLLLGILSSVAVARGLKPSDFEPRALSALTAEQYRFAHGLSTGRYGDAVEFSISTSSDRWIFVTASSAEGEVNREDFSADSLSLSIINAGTTTSLNPTASSGAGLAVQFSTSGDVESASMDGNALQIDFGIELRVVGDSAHSLCIYPTGYIGSSSCD